MRKFGNGTAEQTLYDKAGRVTVKTQKNARSELLWSEGYVYGDDGKRTATVDNLGRITFYEYNNKGQISSIYYPYTQEMINNLKEEAETNGLVTTAEAGENCFLTSTEKANIVPLLNSMQYGLAYKLTNLQVLIKESYTYDAFGSLVQGTMTSTTDHGYLGKQYDPTTRLYNYGYRDYKPQTARFTTLDPIRDGTNWITYCNSDPINFVDLWGLEVETIFSSYKMQDSRWGSDKLNGDSKYNMSGYGCANTLIANIDSSIGGTLTPKDINNTYCEDGSAQWQKYAEDHNMTVNKKNTPLTKEQFDALDYSNDRYYIGAEVVYTNDNHTHFVGINNIRNIEGKDYYEISETSDNDGVVGLESLRGGAGWIKEGDKVYAPVENVKSAVIFKKNK